VIEAAQEFRRRGDVVHAADPQLKALRVVAE
jgi:hypothetical protein